MLGTTLAGKYRIVKLLGEGGMGAVYEGENVTIGKKVAIKTLLAARGAQPAAVARFKREAAVTASIESEHVASILDYGEENGLAYIVMELLRGEDLEHVLQRTGALPASTALRIAYQALRGL